jgi:16S rRNA (adenine1518-N6/adenine1519-N6)-dimethyltransferase
VTGTERVKARLLEMGLQPKRAFGQNFLVNASVIGRIVDAVRARKHSALVEIGPGLGALTEPLLAAELRPRLVEIDDELATYWESRGLDVTRGDALRVDWEKLELPAGSLLVSNLPYNISTSLVVERCFGPVALTDMVLMFQKEVAQRLQAAPRTKEYGSLSVLTQLYFELARVTDASPRDFFPAPKVSSRVLAFRRRPDPRLGPRFLTFVKAAFVPRRKLMLKNLRAVVDKSKHPELAPVLSSIGFSEKARAEELMPEHFASFYRALYRRDP